MILSNTEWRESQKLITEGKIKILLQWVDTISFLLSIDNIGITLVIFLIVTALLIICILTGVGALLVMMGMKSFFDTRTFLSVMEKYEDAPEL